MDVVEFTKDILGINLWPVQETLLRHITRHQDPQDVEVLNYGADYAKEILPFHKTPDDHYGTALMMGQRSGNSVLVRIASLFEVYRVVTTKNPQEFFSIMPNDHIKVLMLCGWVDGGYLIDNHCQNLEAMMVNKAFPKMTKKIVSSSGKGYPTSVTYEFSTEADIAAGRRGTVHLDVISCKKTAGMFRGPNYISILGDSCWDVKNLEELYLSARPAMAMFKDPKTLKQWGFSAFTGSFVPADIREQLTRTINSLGLSLLAYNTSYVNPNDYVKAWEASNPKGCRKLL